MTEIRYEKITKRFKDVTAVHELDLVINSGEFFTFVGPSGCGKSTLLNMTAGLETATRGVIRFDGSPVDPLLPRERDVAMVFQSYALYPHMTVYENVAFPLRMKKVGRRKVDEEVNRVADLLDLGGVLHRKPRELSGGQRQRVALGRAIIRRPRVFLMDEPLSNLDARLRVEMRAELKKLHRDLRITTVYVTHDQAEALSLSDRIGVLHQGRLQQVGTPGEVYMKPANIFVAGFIGSPPMNLIPCTVNTSRPQELMCNGLVLASVPGRAVAGDRVTAGIRPEDVTISGKNAQGCLKVRVSIMEPAGSFNWVDVSWAGQRIRGRSELGEVLNPDIEAFMHFSPDRIFLFHPESGLSTR